LPILFIGVVKICLQMPRVISYWDRKASEREKDWERDAALEREEHAPALEREAALKREAVLERTVWFVLCVVTGFLVEALVICSIELVILTAYVTFQSGVHGPEWVCGKSFTGSLLGWLPSTFCYQVGAAYAGMSLIHGLWLGKKSYQLPEDTKPSADKGCLVSDAFSALCMLRLKFIGLFADTNLDMAQITLFLQRSQPYFALCNAFGLLIQMILFALQLVRGRLPEAPFLSIVLQSDTIVLMRESDTAGFVLHELYEKMYREAFGETYISMIVAIIAVFTSPMEHKSDVALFMLSITLSLSSVKSGVAEALEIVEAEQEQELVGGFRVQMIPSNHYHYRQRLARQRKWNHLALVRVSEALVPVLTAAICCNCSTVQTTYLTACTTAFSLQAVAIVKNHYNDVFNALRKFLERTPCSSVDGLLSVLCGLAALILLLVMLFFASPLLYVLLYAYPVTVSQRVTDEVAAEVFDFSSVLHKKSLFAVTLWLLLGISLVEPQWSPFRFGPFLRQAHGNSLDGWSAKSILAVLQLSLVMVTVAGIVVMSIATCTIQPHIDAWSQRDRAGAQTLKHQCEKLLLAARCAALQMKACSILGPKSSVQALGIRIPPDGTPALILIAARLLNAVYGPPDRPGRITDRSHPGADTVEFLLRHVCDSEKWGQGRYWSPSSLATDLRSVRREALTWYWTSKDSPPKEQVQRVLEALDAAAAWLEGLCLFDHIADPAAEESQSFGGDSYQPMEIDESAASQGKESNKAITLASEVLEAAFPGSSYDEDEDPSFPWPTICPEHHCEMPYETEDPCSKCSSTDLPCLICIYCDFRLCRRCRRSTVIGLARDAVSTE